MAKRYVRSDTAYRETSSQCTTRRLADDQRASASSTSTLWGWEAESADQHPASPFRLTASPSARVGPSPPPTTPALEGDRA
ncbi:hypothetical protein PIIN_08102 [Serendipita indica DSM 11827]|uniref:Uncharacterized protein n=1 Tax=Serendipita indica (strain DSM 11827) TaxID=1109443 RepID=G4TS55_SERID|nr:hypothetical protein PIIN_08102 [Serendipita indica DSM 11827]